MIRKNLWNTLFLATVSAAVMMAPAAVYAEEASDATTIELSDEVIKVNGEAISSDADVSVYAGAQIVYYEEGKDALYGEGDADDAHSAEEAADHTVITITQPGTYRVSGTISRGQIAVDLGEEAEDDENAVVTLILDGADITCTVAPGIAVYNAYECGSDVQETASKDVSTDQAGFRLILADDSENVVNGSHVAKIYKDGTTQEQIEADEAKKKWKFDGAIDSLVSFVIDGERADNGKLTVNADNEGICSALHLTMNGGEVTINSADDAINTNEDYVSVLTINDGVLICDSGNGAEGDGIDSNGWIVVNGGYTIACANGNSMDSGVDADMGISLNGGTLLASGNMYDEVSEKSAQPFFVFSFAGQVEEGQLLMIKNSADEPVAAFSAVNAFTTAVYGSDLITEGEYTLYTVSAVTGDKNGSIYTNITDYQDAVQLQYGSDSVMSMGGGRMPGGFDPGQMPEGFDPSQMRGQIPEGFDPSQMGGQMPEGFDPSQMGGQMPEGFDPSQMGGQMPEGFDPSQMGDQMPEMNNGGTIFAVDGIYNSFSMISEVTE